MLHPALPRHSGLRAAMQLAFQQGSLAAVRGDADIAFSRASVATTYGYEAAANEADGQVVLAVASEEAPIRGARRVSEGVWSDRFADGSPIPDIFGLQLEPAATNLVPDSQNLSAGTWGDIGTPTRGATLACGALTLTLLGDDDGAGLEGIFCVPTFTADGRKGVAIFVKQDTAAECAFGLFDNTAGTFRMQMVVQWSDGEPIITVTAGELEKVEHVRNGIYRICTIPTGVLAASTHLIALYPAGLTPASTGRTYMGGVQAENNEFCTSYIVTSGGTATRAATTAGLTLGDWFNPAEGTVVVRGTYGGKCHSTDSGVPFALSDGTAANIFGFLRDAGTNKVTLLSQTGGVPTVGLSGEAIDAGVPWQAGFCYAEDHWVRTANGEPVEVATSGELPAATELHLGNAPGGILPCACYIAGVDYYPRHLESLLPTLTALPQDGRLSLRQIAGWHDSILINADESRLYFFYARISFWQIINDEVWSTIAGGHLGHRGNVGLGSEVNDPCVYQAELDGSGNITAITLLGFSHPGYAVSSPHVIGSDGSRKVYVNKTTNAGSLLTAFQETSLNVWAEVDQAEFANIHAAHGLTDSADNPWVNETDDLMFFESQKDGKPEIWTTTKSAGVWATPTKILSGGAVADAQFFMNTAETDAYWTRDGVIFHATWNGSAFASVGAITMGGPALSLVGEPTLTADGQVMYFLHLDLTTRTERIMRSTRGANAKTWNAPTVMEARPSGR